MRRVDAHRRRISNGAESTSLVVLAFLSASGCSNVRDLRSECGNVDRGRMLSARYGCASCHAIPGVGASTLAPPLERIGSRFYIAGSIPNTRENMVRWLQHPQHLRPGSVMPEMGINVIDARDIAAFLETLQ
jgi:cytochrome c2